MWAGISTGVVCTTVWPHCISQHMDKTPPQFFPSLVTDQIWGNTSLNSVPSPRLAPEHTVPLLETCSIFL